MVFEPLLEGFSLFLGFGPVSMTALGVFLGIIIGILPGLGPLLGIILMTPLTLYMNPITGMGLLIGVFVGGTCGGAISAILLRIPGTPIAAATLLDGYPMARKGQAPLAVGLAIAASSLGGLLSGICLVFFSPLLAKIALEFAAPEYFALTLTGLITIAIVSRESTIKGLIVGFFGLLISTMGMDPFVQYYRFTFDLDPLLGGVNLVAMVVGLFAVSEMFIQIENGGLDTSPGIKAFRAPFNSVMVTARHTLNLFRSSALGTVLGALPGAGSVISSFVSYAIAKGSSKHPEKFGTGIPDGVVATEAANNACCGGALIPALALAIPGEACTAVLIGALILLGFFPGPSLFRDNPDMVGGIFSAYISANVFLFFLGILFTPIFVSILNLKKNRLIPIVLVLCFMGVYGMETSLFDLNVMMVFAFIAYVLRKLDYPLSPFVISRVLGPILEQGFRRSLIMSGDKYSIFVDRPLCLSILIIDVMFLAWAFMPSGTMKRIKSGFGSLIKYGFQKE